MRRGIALALALPLAGCVPLAKGRVLEARVQRLEVQNTEQQRKIDEQTEVVRDRVAKVDKKIVEVQAKIDELNKAARQSGADLGVQLSRLQEEFKVVRDGLEVEQHRLGEIEKSLGSLRSETEGKLAGLRGAGALDEYDARQKLGALSRPDDKAAVLALADKELDAGNKGVAREIYAEYVRKWPKDPGAAEAGYRLSELLFDGKRFREALVGYARVAETFPRSERAPDAMLGAADAMIRLEMKDDAKSILGELLQKYPKSAAAGRAKERLQELQPPPPPAPEKKKPAAPKKR